MTGPAAVPTPSRRRRRDRLTVRALMLLVGLAGVVLGVGQFWLANRDPDRALISRQLGTLSDRGAPLVARLSAIDAVEGARGRQARRALRALTVTLDDPDAGLRVEASRAIEVVGGRLLDDSGGDSADAVRPAASALLARLEDPDEGAREAAVAALSGLHAKAVTLGVSVIDVEVALPEALAIVGRDHFAVSGARDAWRWYDASRLIRHLMSNDPVVLRGCLGLATEGDDEASRRGAILVLGTAGMRFEPLGGGAPASGDMIDLMAWEDRMAVFRGRLARFLVDRLEANPPGDRPVILHALSELNRRDLADDHLLAKLARASDDPDPRVRAGVAKLLLDHPGRSRDILPRLAEAARLEVDRGDDVPVCRCVLAIGLGAAEAAAVRSLLVEALGRPGDDLRRHRIGSALLDHLEREPGALDGARAGLLRAGEAEAADPGLAPVACDLLSRLDPDSEEVAALRASLSRAAGPPTPEDRRSMIEAVLRAGPGTAIPLGGVTPP